MSKEQISLKTLLRDKRIVEDELFISPQDQTLKRNLSKIKSAISCVKNGGKVFYK